MIVKDLLNKYCERDVIGVIADRMDVEGLKRKRLFHAYHSVYNRLRKTKPVASDFIILGMNAVENGVPYVAAKLFSKTELAKFQSDALMDGIKNVEVLSDKDVKIALSSPYKLPRSFVYEFDAWADVLGYEVDRRNVMEVGGERILADILFEITLFGYTEKNVKKERLRMDRVNNAVARTYEVKASYERAAMRIETVLEKNSEEKMFAVELFDGPRQRERLQDRVVTYASLLAYKEHADSTAN